MPLDAFAFRCFYRYFTHRRCCSTRRCLDTCTFTQKLWHTGAFTDKYTQKLYTESAAYTQVLLHEKVSIHTDSFHKAIFTFTHTHNFCILLRIGALASVSFHAEVPSHAAAEAFKHRCFSTHNLSHTNTHTAHREAVTPKNFCTDTVSAQMLSHTHTELLHTENLCTQNIFHTQTNF